MFSFPPMVVLCPIRLVFRIVNVLMVASLVMSNSHFCASVFETQVDFSLVGYVVNTSTAANKFECHQKCLRDSNCNSFNVHPTADITKRVCELNNKTREMKPGGFIKRKGSSYYGHIKITCQDLSTNRKKGTPTCMPVGVASTSKIPDAKMTASTFHSEHHYPYYGRLNGSRGYGAWCAKTATDRTDYLQVDMDKEYSVCAVATQGHNSGNHWVTSYKLHFSSNAITWNTYNENNVERVFPGNQDQNTVVKHSLRHNVKARFVRFYPVSRYSHPCLRVEIFVLK